MTKMLKTTLAFALAAGMATTAFAQTSDGTSAAAGTKATATGTGNAFNGGNAASMPANEIVDMLAMSDGSMTGKMIGDAQSIKDVRVVTLSELSSAQNVDVTKLNAALAAQNPMVGSLKTSVASNAVVGDALTAGGYNANQVVAASGNMDTGQVIVVVDDRT